MDKHNSDGETSEKTTENEILLSHLSSNFVRKKKKPKEKKKQSISPTACNLSFAIRNRGIRDGYLFLSKFNSEFQPVQVHPLAVLERRPGGIVVQQHLQLVRTSRVIQQGSGKVLALSPKLLESLQRCLGPRRETSFVNNAEERGIARPLFRRFTPTVSRFSFRFRLDGSFPRI